MALAGGKILLKARLKANLAVVNEGEGAGSMFFPKERPSSAPGRNFFFLFGGGELRKKGKASDREKVEGQKKAILRVLDNGLGGDKALAKRFTVQTGGEWARRGRQNPGAKKK